MKLKKISISPKLFIASFIPLALVGFFSIIFFVNVTTKIINENIEHQASGVLSVVENHVTSLFSHDLANLNIIANIALDSTDRNTIARIVKLTGKVSFVSTYYYVTATPLSSGGYMIMSDDTEIPGDFNQFDKPWFKDAVNAERIFAFNTDSKKKCVTISRAVKTQDGKLIGVCAFDMDLSVFSKIAKGTKLTEKSTISMIDVTGRYLATKDESDVLEGNYFEDSDIQLGNMTQEDYVKASKAIVIKNKFYAVKRISFTPWYLVTEGLTSDFTSYFARSVTLVIILVTLICIAATIFLLWYMEKIRSKEKALGDKLYGETQNLAVAAKENAATSQDQSAAVKEIVATMEDTNELAENISKKIKDVNSIAKKTSDDVNSGVASLQNSIAKLREIFDANQHTIDGIKSLGKKIENIWDIVSLINSVADQAKIIAFNAELEVSSAGEAGKNFHIVATEIRRLADGIIDGTKEIKEKINEIQQSSDSLILASESGTEKINEGCQQAQELESKFESIKNASEITVESAGAITTIIQQQTLASEQILITLKQIAVGVDNFTQATESISCAAQNVQEIAEELNEKGKDGGEKS
ncbi:MAG: hypothetical protein II921_04910 [Treponema sp.]|nr:hypothetical protein [Treponema sp.]